MRRGLEESVLAFRSLAGCAENRQDESQGFPNTSVQKHCDMQHCPVPLKELKYMHKTASVPSFRSTLRSQKPSLVDMDKVCSAGL